MRWVRAVCAASFSGRSPDERTRLPASQHWNQSGSCQTMPIVADQPEWPEPS